MITTWMVIVMCIVQTRLRTVKLELYGDDSLKEIWINDNDKTDLYDTTAMRTRRNGTQTIEINPGDTFKLKINKTSYGYLRFGYRFYENDILINGLSTDNQDLIPLWSYHKTIGDLILIKTDDYNTFTSSNMVINVVVFESKIPFTGKCLNPIIRCNNKDQCTFNFSKIFEFQPLINDLQYKFPLNITKLDDQGTLIINNSPVDTPNQIIDNIISIEYKPMAIFHHKATYDFQTYDPDYHIQTCQFSIVVNCYDTCETCSDYGDSTKHNCIQCKSNSELNNGNCKCITNYMFDPIQKQCIFHCSVCIEDCNSKCYKYNGKLYSKTDLMKELKINDFSWEMNITDVKEIIDKESDIPRFIFDLNHTLMQKDHFNITFPHSTASSKHIDMTECELTLKQHYNLPTDAKLKIFIIDEIVNGAIMTTYYIYDHNYNRLDYSLCGNNNIIISDTIPPGTNIKFDEAKDLALKGINVFDSEDPFFNDHCSPHSNNDGLDMILSDRRKDLYQNVTLCQPNCKLIDVDSVTNTFKCNCTMAAISNPIPIKPSAFIDAISMINIVIATCYQHFIYNKQIGYNIGFWVVLSLITFYLICFIRFLCSGFYWLGNQMHKRIHKFDIVNQMIRNQQEEPSSLHPSPPPTKTKKKTKTPISRSTNRLNNNNDLEGNNDNTNNIIRRFNEQQQKKDNDKPIDNNVPFTLAYREDKRRICAIYWSMLKVSLFILNPFFAESDFDLICIKFAVLILNLTIELTINTLLYQDNIISEKYQTNGQLFLFSSILKSFFAFLINGFTIKILILFTQYQERLELVSKEGQNESEYLGLVKKTMKRIKCKVFIFFIFGLLLMLFSLYYITIFCTIYKGSQTSLFLDEGISIAMTLGITILGAFICAILRIIAIKKCIRNLYYTSIYIAKYI